MHIIIRLIKRVKTSSEIPILDSAFLATINLNSNLLMVYGSSNSEWVTYNANLDHPKTHTQFGDAGGLTMAGVADIVTAVYTPSNLVATDYTMTGQALASSTEVYSISSTSDSGKIYQVSPF